LQGTLAGLAKRSIDTVIASSQAGACEGKLGGTVDAHVGLDDVKPAEFDGLALIGGPGSAAFAKDDVVLALARAFFKSGKPVGAICIAPTILAAAGVLEGKRATVFKDSKKTNEQFLTSHGAMYTGSAVTVDGKVVTADGPSSAIAFGDALGDAFAGAALSVP